jgi:hypothetical protein
VDPTPQTQPRLELGDDVDITAIAVLNPAIALIGVEPSLALLVARHIVFEQDATRLLGVRHVLLPTGLKRAFYRIASRIISVRLPDEYDFGEVQFKMWTGRCLARVHAAKVSNYGRPTAFPLRQLDAAQYQNIMTMRGRDLDAWIRDVFRDAITNWDHADSTRSDESGSLAA